jgi:hypothetical protein
MRRLKKEEVSGALIVECYICKMTMPYMAAITDGDKIYCSDCAGVFD